MTNLLPEQYFPCLYDTEQEACRRFWENVVPPYVFVSPKAPIDAYFDGSPVNFPGRQEAWENMFRWGITEIDIGMGVMVEVYTDPYGFLADWLIYPPISSREDPGHCRENDYVLNPT